MLIDASALCGILAREPDAAELLARTIESERRTTSPTAVWECAVALPRILEQPPGMSYAMTTAFLTRYNIEIVPVPAEAAALAVDAYARFGKGRHPAGLNFGDCFAYACARHLGVPLLYKGDDFALTDIDTV
ncbi:type II toxin-antitoxin system VapC family toxin [Jiella sp. M17.18]|uniref:type II toxin-antitoxin system VapC family toxin n=1 Tax=Jiella sp. M17.18 TaxID=3234247 RepID=UPI0034DF6D26